MADLSLRVLADAANAQGAFKDLGSAVTAAGSIIKNFSEESIKAFAESERVSKQLARAAGELAPAFEAQANAMSRALAVDDDQIKSMQTLLLNYGTAPEQVEKTTRAILDYSAATGGNARDATMQLIRGVESGTGTLGRMGVTFETTGSKADDMAKAIEALNEKFGGAAATDADSLAGRMRAASIATEDLEKAWGGLLATIESKYGVLEKVTNVLRNMADARAWSGGTRGVTWKEDASPSTTVGPMYGPDEMLKFGDLKMERTGADQLQKEAAKRQQQLEAQLNAENKYYDQKWLAMMEDIKREDEHDAEVLKGKRALAETEMEIQDEYVKAANKSMEELTKKQMDEFRQQQDDLKRLSDITVSQLKNQQSQWAGAGMQLGQAFSNALEQAMEGGAQSGEDIALDLTQSVLTIAGGIIAGIASEGDPYAMQAGSMLGHLAGTGIKGAVKSSHKNDNSRHDGGWIERYHMGGWPVGRDEVPAVLQTGERVLSRREVSAMGGANAVDAMARGGGGALSIHVTAIDTRSTREFFENQGGRGFYNALRTGRGQLSPIFGAR